jgi:hypothetical protein
MHDKTGAWRDQETFDWWRAAEIKHGRVSMMAAFGLIAGAFYKWPGFESVQGGGAALSDGTGASGFGIFVIIAGYLELYGLKQDEEKEPGDLGDPLGIVNWGVGYTVEGYRNYEINHGRLAMSGVATSLLTEYWTGMTPEFQAEAFQDWTKSVGAPGVVLLVLFLIALNPDDQAALSPEAQSKLKAAPKTAALPAGGADKLLTTDEAGRFRFVS